MAIFTEWENPVDLFMDGVFIGTANIVLKTEDPKVSHYPRSLPDVQFLRQELHITDFDRKESN